MTTFSPSTVTLPNDAIFDGFKMRFRCECNDFSDDWFVDDITLTGEIITPGPALFTGSQTLTIAPGMATTGISGNLYVLYVRR